MIVTGAFFADAASVADGKLFVLGGVWDRYSTDRIDGTARTLTLVILLQAGPDDTGRQAELVVEGRTPDGDLLIRADASYQLPDGSENGFLLVPLPCPFTSPGRHNFTITASGSEIPVVLGLGVVATDG